MHICESHFSSCTTLIPVYIEHLWFQPNVLNVDRCSMYQGFIQKILKCIITKLHQEYIWFHCLLKERLENTIYVKKRVYYYSTCIEHKCLNCWKKSVTAAWQCHQPLLIAFKNFLNSLCQAATVDVPASWTIPIPSEMPGHGSCVAPLAHPLFHTQAGHCQKSVILMLMQVNERNVKFINAH